MREDFQISGPRPKKHCPAISFYILDGHILKIGIVSIQILSALDPIAKPEESFLSHIGLLKRAAFCACIKNPRDTVIKITESDFC